MTTPTAPGAIPDWKKMKVQELRDELTSRGLDTTGVKSTLIERLETAATATKVEDTTAEAGEMKDIDLDINEGAPVDQVDEKETASEKPITTEPPVVAEDIAAEALPVAIEEAPPVNKVADDDSAAAPLEAPAPETNGAPVAAPSTDLEKKQRRAERFGLELMVSEGEKRRMRAARFGDAAGTKTNGTVKEEESSKMSPTLKDAEAVKRKARAARFGIEEVGEKPASSPSGADDSRKKARLARFGVEVKLDPQEQEKKKLRAARFGLTTEAKPEVEPEKKVAVEQPVAT